MPPRQGQLWRGGQVLVRREPGPGAPSQPCHQDAKPRAVRRLARGARVPGGAAAHEEARPRLHRRLQGLRHLPRQAWPEAHLCGSGMHGWRYPAEGHHQPDAQPQQRQAVQQAGGAQLGDSGLQGPRIPALLHAQGHPPRPQARKRAAGLRQASAPRQAGGLRAEQRRGPEEAVQEERTPGGQVRAHRRHGLLHLHGPGGAEEQQVQRKGGRLLGLDNHLGDLQLPAAHAPQPQGGAHHGRVPGEGEAERLRHRVPE
mmetsp:Transcript_8245/g.21039  ORF Transcript_8245/g.21039 Transcript_8245/m.21039 type:complete len:257 (+) Transcript_8245:650-1420(+)